MKRILGFDPGLANTGWGVLDADSSRFKTVDYGTITTPSDISAGKRLEIIYSRAVEIIQHYSPDFAGIESLYFAKNIKSAFPVAQAKGVLLLSLAQQQIRTFEFTPLQIKQSITGSGRAEKEQVQELLKILLGLKSVPKPDHAADALGAAVCCYNSILFKTRGAL